MATLLLRWLSVKSGGENLILKHLVESLDLVELLVINLYEAGNVRACSVI